MLLTAAIIFLAAFVKAGDATNTAAAPVILEGAVQQVDVGAEALEEADPRLRGSIPAIEDDGNDDDEGKDNLHHQNAAMALSIADADKDPRDDVDAYGLGLISNGDAFYLMPDYGGELFVCSDDCYHITLKNVDYKEANPTKCQWIASGSEIEFMFSVGCNNKVMDVSGNRCKDMAGVILYTFTGARNQKWIDPDPDWDSGQFKTFGWCNKYLSWSPDIGEVIAKIISGSSDNEGYKLKITPTGDYESRVWHKESVRYERVKRVSDAPSWCGCDRDVTRDECLLAGREAGVGLNLYKTLNVGSWDYTPCGCFFWANGGNVWIDWNTSAKCKTTGVGHNAYLGLVCKK